MDNFNIDGIVLKDLPAFKKPLDDSRITFRWPKMEDIQALQLTEPLKLTAIRVRGEHGLITGIQLVFKNGIESPLFTKPGATAALETY